MNIPTANPLPIIDNDTIASGTITAVAQTVAIALNGDSGLAIQITGTWVGTLQFEGTLDGTNWVAINAVAASTSLPQVTNTVNGLFRLTPCALAQVHVLATAWTSGTATISIRASAGTGGTFINQVAPVKISDGTTLAIIKAASTAAITTDPAIVVAISPNNTIPVSLATNTPDVTDRAARLLGVVSVKGLALTGQSTNFAAAGTGATTGLDVSSAGNATFIIKNTVAATAYTGSPIIVFEQSDDNSSWGPVSVSRSDTNFSASTHTLPANTANASLMFDAAMEGVNWVRARVTTGTTANGMTIVIQVGGLPFSPTVTAILNPETTKIIGTVNLPSPAITYSAVASSIASAALATDLVTIFGSATKTVNIINIWVTGVQTTAGQAQFLLIKRSTVNTLGTSTVQTRIQYDSNDAAATATVLAYTANPTVGTAIGNVRGDRIFLPGAASASDAQGLLWSFVNGKPMILRGVAQGLCINLNGATITGGSINVTIEWTEI